MPRQHRAVLVSMAILIVVCLDWAMSHIRPLTVLHFRGQAVSQVDRRTLHERVLAFRQAAGTISLGWASHQQADAFSPPTPTRLICLGEDQPLPKPAELAIRNPRAFGFDAFYDRRPEILGESSLRIGISVPHWFLALLAAILPMWRIYRSNAR